MQSGGKPFELVCLSHLRWDFVWQRPQQLLSRCARERRVFFVEEPVFADELAMNTRVTDGLTVAVPHLPRGLSGREAEVLQEQLLLELLEGHEVNDYVLWFYTPMAVGLTKRLAPKAVIYDCMDELSAFAGAPPEMVAAEEELLRRAHLVFTGGRSLYEAKRHRHSNVHLFPSSVDVSHFAQAR